MKQGKGGAEKFAAKLELEEIFKEVDYVVF